MTVHPLFWFFAFCVGIAVVSEIVLYALRRRPELHADDQCGENGMR